MSNFSFPHSFQKTCTADVLKNKSLFGKGFKSEDVVIKHKTTKWKIPDSNLGQSWILQTFGAFYVYLDGKKPDVGLPVSLLHLGLKKEPKVLSEEK